MNSVAGEGSSGPIVLTPTALRRVDQLARGKGNAALMFRVYIQGGGCSGFQYGFGFEEQPQEDDTVLESGGVRVVVDPMSLQYLMGSQVDYKEDLQGARFVIENPNASTTCGCGSSFSI